MGTVEAIGLTRRNPIRIVCESIGVPSRRIVPSACKLTRASESKSLLIVRRFGRSLNKPRQVRHDQRLRFAAKYVIDPNVADVGLRGAPIEAAYSCGQRPSALGVIA